MVVAIDGPAGAGKSTVARALAQALDYTYLDSGAMYRAVGLLVLEHGGTPAERAAELEVELGDRVIVNGRDVTEAIRTPDASAAASRAAVDRSVRMALVDKQRRLLGNGDWVAEGRDIGTVVAPDARLKIFLTASPEERAKRRAAELGTDWRTVFADQVLRDEQDRSREHSPLRAAVDSIELDTTGRTIEDVVSQIVGLVREVGEDGSALSVSGSSGAAVEPAEAAAEPARAGSEPAKTAAEPARTGAEPAKTAAEPARAGAEPAKTVADSSHAAGVEPSPTSPPG